MYAEAKRHSTRALGPYQPLPSMIAVKDLGQREKKQCAIAAKS